MRAALFSRADRSALGHWWWTVDRRLLAVALALLASGVMLVAAASPPVAERIGLGQYHFIIRHLVVLAVALPVLLGVSLLSPRNIWRLASIMLLGGIAALVYVLFAGAEIKGAQRWIHLPGFSLQPSEFVKVSFAITAAWLMARHKENPAFPGNKIAAGLFFAVLVLLMLQPDLGMSFVVSCIYGAQLFLAGFPLLWVFALVLIGFAGIVGAYFTLHHVRSRIDRFFDPASGDSYQVQKSIEAFQSGGILGTGPGQGTVKLHLPDAHADFIFAVAGEELGLVFALILIGLFAYVVLRGFNKIMDSDNMFVVLAVGGLLVMFGLQTLVHIGSSVNLLPAKGMTLPFISYGGSSLLASCVAMGVVLALTKRQARAAIAKSGRMMKRRAPAV